MTKSKLEQLTVILPSCVIVKVLRHSHTEGVKVSCSILQDEEEMAYVCVCVCVCATSDRKSNLDLFFLQFLA